MTKTGTKIPKEEYLTTGKNIIIDQGKDSIAGYTDRQKGIFKEVPVIVFGDHTRIVKYVDKPFFLGADGVKVLKSKEKESNYKYLYYALKAAHIPNTGYNRHFKWLKQININYPDFNEQKNIVDILDSLTRVIKVRQKELAFLDKLIKARFVEMFGDIKANDKLWPTESFNSLFEVTSSKRILKSNWQSSGNIPFLRVRDMVCLSEGKELNNEFYISEKLYDSLSDIDGVPAPGDILISATSTLGKCHIVLENEKFYFKDADILRFRPRKEINATYFVEAMENFYIRDQINRTLGITTVKHLTIKATKSLFMRVPPISLQNEFANFIHQVDKSKVAVQKSLDETQKLYDSLMQEYFG